MRSNSLFRACASKLVYAARSHVAGLRQTRSRRDSSPANDAFSKDEIARRTEGSFRMQHRRWVSLPPQVRTSRRRICNRRRCCTVRVLPRGSSRSRMQVNADEITARLRASAPPIIARVEDASATRPAHGFPEQDASLSARSHPELSSLLLFERCSRMRARGEACSCSGKPCAGRVALGHLPHAIWRCAGCRRAVIIGLGLACVRRDEPVGKTRDGAARLRLPDSPSRSSN